METIKFNFGGAEIALPEKTVAQNWLQSVTDQKMEPEKQLTPVPIGTYWPEQGGIYAGIARGENGEPDYHLIVADGDEGEAKDIAWGKTSKKIKGVDSERDGAANTHAIASNDNEHPAAEWANGLTINSHSDWYLPARRELALCFANVPELFEKCWHWSSTQFSAYGAWGQGFGTGDQSCNHEDCEARARAVRRFISY